LQISRYITQGPGHEDEVRRQRRRGLAEGRTSRSIFAQSVLESPRWFAFAERRAADGELQRYLPADAIPVGFAVFGRAGVMMGGGGAEQDFLLVRDPALVD